MMPRFEVWKICTKAWRFQLRARNGKIILISRTYFSRRNAVLGIRSIQETAPDAIVIYEKE